MDDWQLLQAYASDRSEAAFAKLVRLHLDWVYSVALRHVRDPHLAQDVVQSVFVLLATKAGAIRPGTSLGGWLFRTTCHVSAHARRAEYRRKMRETIGCTMIQDTTSTDSDEILWQQLSPHLDLAVADLSEADRSAILLRFYEKAPMLRVAEKLGVSEEAAKKRVARAVERMRQFLAQRGVKPGAVVLAAVLAEKTVQAAPAALAGAVVKVSVGSTSLILPELARQTLNAWRWAKVKLTAGLAVSSLALIFVVASVSGLLTRQSALRAASNTRSPDIGSAAQSQDVTALSASIVNPATGTFPKAGAITGLVLDEAQHPVTGAKVWGGYDQDPFAQDTTDASGQFALDKIDLPSFVTVTADGFAADQQQFNPTNLPGPLIFRLTPVPPLKLRVVDEGGRGLAGVALFLSQWWGRAGTLGQDAPQHADRTGSDGFLQWLSPPKGELELQFGKPGYRYSRTNKLAADGREHVVVLHPAATVTGNVTDAETGAPLDSFKITIGYSQRWNPSHPVPMWELHSEAGSNGYYRTIIEEEQVPFLRIEAPGFETVETKIQLTNGIEGTRDFRLSHTSAANSIRGTVLLPDGSPAAGVEVALCTTTVGVMLKGTAFERGVFGNIGKPQWDDYRRKTDERGSFSLGSKPGAHTVVAVGPSGLGQVRCFDFSKPLEIRLQSWGRIEGNVRTRDGQWGDRKLKWTRTGNLTDWKTLFYDSEGFSTRSDASGEFTIENVPPGDGRVVIDDGPGTAPIVSDSISVNPGGRAQVQIGGFGRTVTGRLVAPPGIEVRSWSTQVTFAQLHVEWNSYRMPNGLTGNAVERWKLEFEDTEAGRAWFRNQYSYDFKVEPDGSFTIPEVLPGKYRLFVNVSQGNLGSGPELTPPHGGNPQIASSGIKLEVPNASGDIVSPMDLGEIVLTATH